MKALLEKLGRDPQRSLAIFLRGLGLFALGLFFISIGYFYHYLWQIVGLVVITLACLIAAWGYIGIFSNRWLTMLSRNKPKHKNVKF